jgi:transcriptional regulator with XRE-family HTH domain
MEEKILVRFGQRLKQARICKGFSQEKLADVAN